VNEPDTQELKIKVVDDGTRRALGDLTIPLSSLLKEPKMELFQRPLQLRLGVHSSTLVITIRLRSFVPVTEQDLHIRSTYGTASHIERANGKGDSTITTANGSITQAAASTEPGKTVNTVNRPGDISLESGNMPEITVIPEITHSPSSITDSSFGTPSKRNSRTPSILGRLGMVKRGKRAPSGQLQLGLRYDENAFKLTVDIIAARGLNSLNENGKCDAYVTAKLVPTDSSSTTPKGKRKTPISSSTDPIFNSSIDFDVTHSQLQNYKLRIKVKDASSHGLLSRSETLGMVEVPLNNFDAAKESGTRWIQLE